jgi:hypothetical protein
MKRVNGKYVSEGKLIEVTPIITDAVGMPMALPPMVWPVENWVLNYTDEQVEHMPRQYMGTDRTFIAGSYPARECSVQFMFRVLEGGAAAFPATVDKEAVADLVAAFTGRRV